MKIYLYIKSENVLIYSTTWKNGADVGNLESVFCMVNGSLEDVEKKMEDYHPILDSHVKVLGKPFSSENSIQGYRLYILQVTLSFCSR